MKNLLLQNVSRVVHWPSLRQTTVLSLSGIFLKPWLHEYNTKLFSEKLVFPSHSGVALGISGGGPQLPRKIRAE